MPSQASCLTVSFGSYWYSWPTRLFLTDFGTSSRDADRSLLSPLLTIVTPPIQLVLKQNPLLRLHTLDRHPNPAKQEYASLMCNAVTSETKILISASVASSPGTKPSKDTVEGHLAMFQVQGAQEPSVKIALFPSKWGATCKLQPVGQRVH